MSHDDFDPDRYEIRHFSCAERAALKAHLIARAHEERVRLLRRWAGTAIAPLAALRRGLQKLFVVIQTAIRRALARQRRFAELRQLAAMSDLELRDIGIARMEIRAAMESGAHAPRYGLRACSATQTSQGDKHAESLLDCPRLGS